MSRRSVWASRVAVAAITMVSTLAGFAIMLHGIGNPTNQLLAVVACPFLGVFAAKAVVRDAVRLYSSLVAVAAYLGLWVGASSSPWQGPLWIPPELNTAWVAAWVFAAALLGTLPVRTRQPTRGWSEPPWLLRLGGAASLVFVIAFFSGSFGGSALGGAVVLLFLVALTPHLAS